MIRPLLLVAGLLLVGCISPEERMLPDSRLMFHVTPLTVMSDIHGLAVVTAILGGLAGAAVSCATVSLSVDGVERTRVEPDCDPEKVDYDGGALSWQIVLGQGSHSIAVEAQEPGRKALRAWRDVEVR